MVEKKDIEKILGECDGELNKVLNKVFKPFVVIDPSKKAEEIIAVLGAGKEKKPEKEPAPKNDYKVFEEEAVAYWNNFVKKYPALTAVIKVSDERRKHLKQRFSVAHFRDNYKRVVDRIEKSKFLLGFTDKKWKVGFDFIIQNDTNYVKILEGKYDDEAPLPIGIKRYF